MTREDARKTAEVMLAYADGKEIQAKRNGYANNEWFHCSTPEFDFESFDYRIKPESTYRPFANAEECWEEMKKHEPFGWMKGKATNADKVLITRVSDTGIALFDETFHYYETAQKLLIFADGTPFGKLTEEG